MQEPPMLEELVDRVLLAVRDMTPRDTIELGVLHGFCLDTAKDLYPERVPFLSSARGLENVVEILRRRSDVIVPDSDNQSRWRFAPSDAPDA